MSLTAFLHWFRLTRPWNVLAMGGVVFAIRRWLDLPMEDLATLRGAGWLAVPMLIGAAGNLINDYFDIREDRINKPHKAHVGRTVKRRVVMVSHWFLTLLGLGWSAWLGMKMTSHLPLILSMTVSLILYFYSPWLKGKNAWGNLSISLCVFAMIVWAALPALWSASGQPFSQLRFWGFTGLIVAMNFVREWVKDVQDLVGDRVAGHQTMAARFSQSQNKWGLLIASLVVIVAASSWMTMVQPKPWEIVIWSVASCALIHRAFTHNVQSLSAWYKASMGILFLTIL
ncbi:MAG: UbiA family prenyltransferase [Bacteroidetes bacterium]|nr:UbiA family prenyltransferase [Bacteroidota bacterium]MDA1242566.1 UbiA family prenyltransferase [Bacteroidota bacterium]